ncbi:hypothetical protein ILUMI_25750 [Ignelater luminosus]|uniref:Uncharacterized protein n=1 Tax=Ignelater luminosus TaxID=2038154 RepID=A0A8K0C7U3_IGNLU|nr:hypothetical protein ILUMI_25750 [Ignelater luminosus]
MYMWDTLTEHEPQGARYSKTTSGESNGTNSEKQEIRCVRCHPNLNDGIPYQDLDDSYHLVEEIEREEKKDNEFTKKLESNLLSQDRPITGALNKFQKKTGKYVIFSYENQLYSGQISNKNSAISGNGGNVNSVLDSDRVKIGVKHNNNYKTNRSSNDTNKANKNKDNNDNDETNNNNSTRYDNNANKVNKDRARCKLKLGTWNLQGLNKEGALKNLIKEAKSYNLDVLAVQETHLRGSDIMELEDYVIFEHKVEDMTWAF